MDPDDELQNSEWFCPTCVAARNRDNPVASGLFGSIYRIVDESITRAYALPYNIREYFEGVRTGDEGEFEDIGLPRTQHHPVRTDRSNFPMEPNYKELRDNKGNFITCYHCGLTSNGRDIIPCDYCPARWHLDCLDPPLAVAPRRKTGDNLKPNATWRCPLHAEHDLAKFGRAEFSAPGDIGNHQSRLRRPKNPISKDVSMERGFRNNGVIDVTLMKEDDARIAGVEMYGQVYRLPERGIRLDFIDRVKKSWYEDNTFPGLLDAPKHLRGHLYRPNVLERQEKPEHDVSDPRRASDNEMAMLEANAMANAKLRRKTLREQQAVLQLLTLAQDSEISQRRC